MQESHAGDGAERIVIRPEELGEKAPPKSDPIAIKTAPAPLQIVTGLPPARLQRFRSISITAAGLIVLLVIGIGLLGWWNSQRAARAIENVLRQERALLLQAGANVGTWNASAVVAQYIHGMRAIDTSNCPMDFQESFLQYVQAWESSQQDAAANEGFVGFVKGFLEGLGAVEEVIDTQQASAKRIREKWQGMERLALKYGARLPGPGR